MRTIGRVLAISAFIILLAAFLAVPSAGQSKDSKKDPDQIGNREVGRGVNFYSLEKEIALGKELAQEIERQAKLVNEPIPAEFINRMAQNLARNSDLMVPVTAKMIDSDQVNAFALPGGFLFVNSGLFLRAETEAELAGPIAHEIAHVAARHGTRQVSRGQIANLATIPLIFIGGWAGYAARQGAGVAVPLGFLKFSRGFEEEADLLGIQYMYKAGYDPNAFIDFFEKLNALERKKPGTLSEIFRSHPNIDKRIKSAQLNIETLLRSRPDYVITTSEFDDVRQGLAADLNRRKATPAKTGPTLHRSKDSTAPIEDRDGASDKDERPTLKRSESLDRRKETIRYEAQ
jgi:predicted Zn-dependent protease